LKNLIDTSVWINHLREPVSELVKILSRQGSIVMHPFVLQELLLSNSKKSEELVKQLKLFPILNLASGLEIENFLKDYPLRGKGIGLIDIHLLYGTIKSNLILLTHDTKLEKVYNSLR